MEKLKPYLLQHVPVRYIKNQLNQIDSTEDQLCLLSVLQLVDHIGYSRSILSHLITFRESQRLDVDEHVYQTYSDLIVIGENSSAHLHKVVYGNQVVINEEPNTLFQDGSTGRRTWEAAIGLGEYLLTENPFNSLPVIELGAGTGLVGITIARSNLSPRVYLSDGNAQVVDAIDQNLQANNVQNVASSLLLEWGSTEAADFIDKISPCWLIGADITYDESLFPQLLSSLALAVPRVLLSCTIRSQNTINELHRHCENMGLCLNKVYSLPAGGGLYNTGFIYPETPEIIVYKLEKLSIDRDESIGNQ